MSRAAATVVAALVVFAAGCGGSSEPQAVVREDGAWLTSLAFDGDRIGWTARETGTSCVGVYVRDLSTGVTRRFDKGGTGCSDLVPRVALGREGVACVWQPGGNHVDDLVLGSWGAHTRARRLADYDSSLYYGPHAYFSGFAHDGDAIYWGWRHTHSSDRCLDDPSATCPERIDGGGVARWSGGAVTSMPGAPAVWAIAADAERLVVLGTDIARRSETPRYRAKVVVLRTRDGAAMGSFPWRQDKASATAIALSGSRVVVLAPNRPLELRLVRDGWLLRRVRLPAGVWRGLEAWQAPTLRADAERAVITNESDTIYIVDLESGRLATVARRGLSIVGAGISEERLFWGENKTREDRSSFAIRSMPLPA